MKEEENGCYVVIYYRATHFPRFCQFKTTNIYFLSFLYTGNLNTTQLGCNHGVSCGFRHLNAWLGPRDLCPGWRTHIAIVQKLPTRISQYMDLSVRLLECTYNMAVAFHQNELCKREGKLEVIMPFLNQSLKSRTITFAIFYSLESSH